MPFQVRVAEGDHPRLIAENLNDEDAHDLARRVSQATGETVQLIPWLYDAKTAKYVLATKPAKEIGAAPAEPEAVEEPAPKPKKKK